MTDYMDELHTLITERDKVIEGLLEKIATRTGVFDDDSVSLSVKYKSLMSLEYLFIRLRIVTEAEHISVKKILSQSDVSPHIRGVMSKRDVYLSQVTAKLQAIREDINVFSRLYWNYSNKN